MTEAAGLIEVDDLAVRYPVPGGLLHALRGVSLSVAPGEIVGIVGESGCGKSTLAYAMLGDIGRGGEVDGALRFDGENILGLSRSRLRSVRGRRVAMVPQHPGEALNPGRTIGDQLKELLSVHDRLRGEAAERRIAEMLALLRLPDPKNLMRRWPHELSGGQLQRVTIAMALLAGPQLLVLDEPTTGLDVTVEAAILDLLRDIRRDLGVAMVFISHNLNIVARLCDRVVVMYAGRIAETGPAVQIFRKPRHPYTRALLDCVPRADTQQASLRPIPGTLPNSLADIEGCLFAGRCALVTAGCLTATPPLLDVGPGHRAACIHTDRVPEAMAIEARGEPARPDGGRSGAALTVSDLSLTYHVRTMQGSVRLKAVANASFSVAPGTVTALVGESGSGKTSLVSAVAGLRRIDAGVIRLRDETVPSRLGARPRWVNRFLQMVFQDHASTLNPELRAGRGVYRAVRLLTDGGRREAGKRAEALFREVRLDPGAAYRRPRELSGGQRQRVAIARAFAGRPGLVICDEITSALDVSVQAQVLAFLQDMQRAHDTSLLFVTHDLGVVRQIAQDVIVMYRGAIVEHGPVASVFAVSCHPYTRTLLRASVGSAPEIAEKPEERPAETEGVGCRFAARCPRWIGPVCNDTDPPWRTISQTHRVLCHLPVDKLSDDGLPAGGALAAAEPVLTLNAV